jgi:hypothetical protein
MKLTRVAALEGSEMENESDASYWKKREEKVLSTLEYARSYYLKNAERARILHRSLSLATLICGILAPIFVVGTVGAGASTLGFDDTSANVIAVILTISLSLSEGLWRMFRPDERWTACLLSAEELRRAREDYRDSRIGHVAGTVEWQKAYRKLRVSMENTMSSETKQFFEAIRVDPRTDQIKDSLGR